jgi:hypothetical protein
MPLLEQLSGVFALEVVQVAAGRESHAAGGERRVAVLEVLLVLPDLVRRVQDVPQAAAEQRHDASVEARGHGL